jgi:hypothetical protein
MATPFVLPRFSGSTLEPSTEPIMLYEPQYYEKGRGRATHIQLIPTRPTPPLRRANKPTYIIIPEPNFDDMYTDDGQFSAWSYEENDSSLLWDSATEISTGSSPLVLTD